MNTPTQITLPVVRDSFKRITTPFDGTGRRNLVMIARVEDLPEQLMDWREINPREVKTTNRVPRTIRETLQEGNSNFVFINRGITLIVDSYDFDNAKDEVILTLADRERHGLLDGAHTMQVILEERDSLPEDTVQLVKVEVLSGFDLEESIEIAEGRNTSNQVKTKSMSNLRGEFDKLKRLVRDKSYADNIAYAENEAGDIDVQDLVRYMYIFQSQFLDRAATSQPVEAYKSKAKCLNSFIEHSDRFEPIYSIALDLFELWDHIHIWLPKLYNRAGGRFGRLSSITTIDKNDRKKETELYFINLTSQYRIPAALKFPFLGAFRPFVHVDNEGRYSWATTSKPHELLDSYLGDEVARIIGESISETRNASKSGWDNRLWRECYRVGRNFFLEERENL